jgi:hypothetical protein
MDKIYIIAIRGDKQVEEVKKIKDLVSKDKKWNQWVFNAIVERYKKEEKK